MCESVGSCRFTAIHSGVAVVTHLKCRTLRSTNMLDFYTTMNENGDEVVIPLGTEK